MTGRPAALSALAFASTARVADSAMLPIRAETRRCVVGVVVVVMVSFSPTDGPLPRSGGGRSAARCVPLSGPSSGYRTLASLGTSWIGVPLRVVGASPYRGAGLGV